MKKQLLALILLGIFGYSPYSVFGQSAFDKAEKWLLKHHLQISYAHQLAWFKESHITFVQPEYGRDIIFENVHARDNPKSFSIGRGEIGTSQFTVKVGIDISKKYSLLFMGTHLNYIVLTDRSYYRNGTWNDERVSDIIRLDQYFRKLEHSNGLNTFTLGLRRNFWITKSETKKARLLWSIMPQVGAVFAGTQVGVLNPEGIYEHYDPGNIIAGYTYAIDFAPRLLLFEHFELGINLNYFQMLIHRARVAKDSYINQQLRGVQYGVGVGYRF